MGRKEISSYKVVSALLFSSTQGWLTCNLANMVISSVLPRQGARTTFLCAAAGEGLEWFFHSTTLGSALSFAAGIEGFVSWVVLKASFLHPCPHMADEETRVNSATLVL